MTPKEEYLMALELAFEAHEGQFDKAGEPYIEHVLAVADGVCDIKEKTVALLHDVIEDTDLKIVNLFGMGFSSDVIGGVNAVSKKNGKNGNEGPEKYHEYISRVASNKLAKAVKISDLKDNMQLDRIADPKAHDIKRTEKYKAVLAYLTVV